MKRRQILPLFVVCVAIVLSVMAWLTLTIRRLEAEQRKARDQAALEESVRLALWRMESLLGQLLAPEYSRSHAFYRAHDPARERTRSRSPARPRSSPFVLLHFQWDEKNRVTSPLPPSRPSKTARKTAAEPEEPRDWMRSLEKRASRDAILARLGTEWLEVEPARRIIQRRTSDIAASAPPTGASTPSRSPASGRVIAPSPPQQRQQVEAQQTAEQNDTMRQTLLNRQEWQARSHNVISNIKTAAKRDAGTDAKGRVKSVVTPARSPEIRVGMMTPLWLDGELLLVRRVRFGENDLVQGCRLNWPALQSRLLDSARDLLPEARLAPIRDGETDPARRLAALPVRLEPGRLVLPLASTPSTLRMPLVIAWTSTVVSLMAVAALLWGIASLGERRAAFVSAVTHELRTPLTTFRMYAEMLADNMIADEGKRQEYLETLRQEAERQTHLVENVLSYARLERGRHHTERDTLAVSDLMRGMIEALRRHAEQCGMTLVDSIDPTCATARVSVDAAAVERVLFNLVDNACKYARDAADRRVHLDGRAEKSVVTLTVADHGPGLSAKQARRLFRPFRKSAREAANSAPGIGLGLALSRRLARAMGGDLRLERADSGGAAFELKIRRA
jgi:signal transduction histidine kinase